MGKYGPLAPDFGYIFWAQFIASQETIFSLKILAKLDAMGPNFPICMTWEILLSLRPGKKRTKKLIDRDILRIAGGESNKQSGKFTFLRHPVGQLVLADFRNSHK